jgi:AcrR family transcriptional regulator
MQKLDGVEDLRVRRTRKLLQQALVEGTVEKGFVALTVRDITERAMVNRSTFYRDYLDKYDLLEQHLNEIYDVLEKGGIIGEGRPEGLIDEGIIGSGSRENADPFKIVAVEKETQASIMHKLRF